MTSAYVTGPMPTLSGQRNDDGRSSGFPDYSPRLPEIPFMPFLQPIYQPSYMPPIGNASPTQHEHRLHEKLSETNLYIRGLGAETTDQELHKMCEKFGKIVSTKAIIDNETGKCKGYGFVDFENPDSAQKAVQKLTNEGKLVQMAKKQEEDPTNIYFSNLPDWIGDKSLREMLEPYGDVVSTRILRHPGQNGSEGRSKGVGFARMHVKEQCDRVIEKFNGQPLTDPKDVNKSTVKPLLVKFADGGPKKKKNHQLNITTNFRRDDMMMDHGLPVAAWHGLPMPIPYPPNVPIPSYQPYPSTFPSAQFGVHIPTDFSGILGNPSAFTTYPTHVSFMQEPTMQDHSQDLSLPKQEQQTD